MNLEGFSPQKCALKSNESKGDEKVRCGVKRIVKSWSWITTMAEWQPAHIRWVGRISVHTGNCMYVFYKYVKLAHQATTEVTHHMIVCICVRLTECFLHLVGWVIERNYRVECCCRTIYTHCTARNYTLLHFCHLNAFNWGDFWSRCILCNIQQFVWNYLRAVNTTFVKYFYQSPVAV